MAKADRKTSQLFSKNANIIAKASLLGVVLLVGGLVGLLMWLPNSAFWSEVGIVKDQPVPFSHEHHTQGLGIDCRYCHRMAEKSSFAGIPPVSTCMNCHSQIWADSPMLEPVREAYREGGTIPWVRVHDNPDFVYFDHSVHLAKGVGCTTCHGPVHEMPIMWKKNSLYMGWCLECHRNPEPYIRGEKQVFDKVWPPTSSRIAFLDRILGTSEHGEGHAGVRGESRVHAAPADPIHKGTPIDLMQCSVCHR